MALREHFDVFLSHNSKDKSTVLEVSKELKARGVKVWIDEELRPGTDWQKELELVIETTGSAAIMFGQAGLGPWENREMRACLHEFVRRSLPVIPVLLPGAPTCPELPVFLRDLTWVDLRGGITKSGIDRLVWGITQIKTLETTRQLVIEGARRTEGQMVSRQFVDAWGIASVKSRLHALSEIVAQAASEQAALAAATYKEDTLSIIVPITFEMRWHRGYAAALERILKVPRQEKRISDFPCEEPPGGCRVSEGVVSARNDGEGRVLIMLDDEPALFVTDLEPEELGNVLDSINLHGRLGVPSHGGLNLTERIGEIPVRCATTTADGEASVLFQNREVLAPLIARLGMPGAAWLLTEEEEFPDVNDNLGGASYVGRRIVRDLWTEPAKEHGKLNDEVFDAQEAVRASAHSNVWSRAQLDTVLQAILRRRS